MLSGLTRQEQKILLFLILVITIGMGIHYVGRPGRHGVWVESDRTVSEEVTGATSAAGTIHHGEQSSGETLRLEAQPRDVEGRLNINQATLEELDKLPGIGPKRAQLIIDYREANKGFRVVEELLNISGIGEKTYSQLERYVYVGELQESQPASSTPRFAAPSSPLVTQGTAGIGQQERPQPVLTPDISRTRININTASFEELKSLKYIGDVLAERIIQYRQEHGPFSSPQDIMKVKGIGPARYEENKLRIVVK